MSSSYGSGKQLCEKCQEYRGMFDHSIIYVEAGTTIHDQVRNSILYANDCNIHTACCMIMGNNNNVFEFGNFVWGTGNSVHGDNNSWHDPYCDNWYRFLIPPSQKAEDFLQGAEVKAKKRFEDTLQKIFEHRYRTSWCEGCDQHGVLYMNRHAIVTRVEPLSSCFSLFSSRHIQRYDEIKLKNEAEAKERYELKCEEDLERQKEAKKEAKMYRKQKKVRELEDKQYREEQRKERKRMKLIENDDQIKASK